MNTHSIRKLGFILVILACMIQAVGCGIKGPPFPTDRVRPPAVSDLNISTQGQSVSLSWTVPHGTDWEKFIVYRAKKELIGPGCSKCPPKFEKAAAIRNVSNVLTFTEKVEIGFKYFYKVIGRTNAGAFSGDSNVVERVH